MEIANLENSNLVNSSEDLLAPINIGDKIRINKICKEKEKLDPEDYFYIKDFENKTGIIREKHKNSSGSYVYRVDFDGDKFGYFYDKDFSLENN